MENLIKELERRKQKEIDYQLELTLLDNTSYKSSYEYRELADELHYSDTRINLLDEIIFFLQEGVWDDEVEHRIKVIKSIN